MEKEKLQECANEINAICAKYGVTLQVTIKANEPTSEVLGTEQPSDMENNGTEQRVIASKEAA